MYERSDAASERPYPAGAAPSRERVRAVALAAVLLVGACGETGAPGAGASRAAEAAATPAARGPDAAPRQTATPAEVFRANATAQTPSDAPALGGGYVYWLHKADVGRQGLGQDRVQRQPTRGGDVEEIAGPASILAVAADRERVYWLQAGGALWARAHSGGAHAKVADLPRDVIRFVLGERHVLARGKGLALVPKAGGRVETLPDDPAFRQSSLLADGDRFYVLTSASVDGRPGARVGTLQLIEPGRPVRVLVRDFASPGRVLGVAGDHVYFSGQGATSVSPRLFRVVREGGAAPEPVGDERWGFQTGRIVDGTFYGAMFVGRWGVSRWPLGSATAPVPVATLGSGMPDGFDVDDRHVYWVLVRDVHRAPR